MSFHFFDWLSDLKERRVFRVAAIYAAVAWAVVEVSDVAVPATGMPGWVITTVVILAMLGFPVIVILAWVFDVSKDGIVRTKPSSATGILTIVFSIALLCVGTAGMVWLLKPGLESDQQKSEIAQRAPAADNSVAVLPFENLSADPNNAYFADGLTDTLLHMLAGVRELKVAARTSSFAFKGEDRDIRDIAAAIGVSHVLEGSVQRDDKRIRVTAQLIRADDGYHVWSRNFDALLEDVFTIQDEIAGEVANELAASMLEKGEQLRPEGVDTSDLAAYDLYLEARESRLAGGVEGLTRSIQLLQRAVVQDPGFLDAKTELALNLAALKSFQSGPELDDAVMLLEQILAADPTHPRARALMAYIDLYEAIEARNAARVNENVQVMEQLLVEAPGETDVVEIAARLLLNIGQAKRALEINESLLANDPLNAGLHLALANNHKQLGQYDQARAYVERALELNPRSTGAHKEAATLGQHVGDGVAYVTHMARASELDPLDWETHAYTAMFLYHIGLIEEGDRYRDKLLIVAPNEPMTHYVLVTRAVGTGDGETIYRLVGDRVRGKFGPRCCSTWEARELQALIRQAALDERLPETIAFINEYFPGFSDLENVDLPGPISFVRTIQINAIRGDRSLQEMNAYVDRVEAWWNKLPNASGRGIAARPDVHVPVLVMRGQMNAAADVALDTLLNQARIHFQDWREYFAQPCFEEFVTIPRVREVLERWNEEELQLRESARELLKAY